MRVYLLLNQELEFVIKLLFPVLSLSVCVLIIDVDLKKNYLSANLLYQGRGYNGTHELDDSDDNTGH